MNARHVVRINRTISKPPFAAPRSGSSAPPPWRPATLAVICSLLATNLLGCSSTQHASEPKNPLAGFHTPPGYEARMKEISAESRKGQTGRPSKPGFQSSFDVLKRASGPASPASTKEVAK